MKLIISGVGIVEVCFSLKQLSCLSGGHFTPRKCSFLQLLTEKSVFNGFSLICQKYFMTRCFRGDGSLNAQVSMVSLRVRIGGAQCFISLLRVLGEAIKTLELRLQNVEAQKTVFLRQQPQSCFPVRKSGGDMSAA